MAKVNDWLDDEDLFFRYEHKKKEKKKKESSHDYKSISTQDHWEKGRVLSLSPNAITVGIGDKLVSCSIKGSLKHRKGTEKNLIAVGDWVQVEVAAPDVGVITHIEPRHSFLSRRDSFSQRKQQLIAVNIDQVFITLSVVAPRFTPMLVDRYIIATKKGNMEPIILINKIDLLSNPPEEIPSEEIEAQENMLDSFCAAYASLDIPIFQVSCKQKASLDPLKHAMHHKTSVFSGQSGVGKSSLINATIQTTLPIGDLIEKSRKGRHTTTTAKLIPLTEGGFCIDTPGIKSFSLWDLTPGEVRSYFPDFDPFADHCHFPNCTHQHEPDCAVKEAVESGRIHSMRYTSYSALLEEPNPKEWE